MTFEEWVLCFMVFALTGSWFYILLLHDALRDIRLELDITLNKVQWLEDKNAN